MIYIIYELTDIHLGSNYRVAVTPKSSFNHTLKFQHSTAFICMYVDIGEKRTDKFDENP